VTNAVPAVPTVPVDRLPARPADAAAGAAEEVARVRAAWLLSYGSAHTRRAYGRDLDRWLAWCAAVGTDPRAARRCDVDAYVRLMEGQEGASPATRARRLSAVSSWYGYAVAEGAAAANPVTHVRRPRVDGDSSATVGLSAAQARALLAAAGTESARTVALLRLLALTGLRVGAALGARVEDLGHDCGHRVLAYTSKGAAVRRTVVPPAAAAALQAYLAARGHPSTGPLFVTAAGKPLDQPYVFRLIRRVAKRAGLPSADRLSPHSLRHSYATIALDCGAPLRDVQDALDHADPRTTRRYDRSRRHLDRSPSYAVAARLGG
jgi:integrase/recombinase XerD